MRRGSIRRRCAGNRLEQLAKRCQLQTVTTSQLVDGISEPDKRLDTRKTTGVYDYCYMFTPKSPKLKSFQARSWGISRGVRSNPSNPPHLRAWLRSTNIANCVFHSFLSYTAIMLNIVTIHAISKTSSLPNTLKTFLLSLTVSDVGVGLLS